MTAFLDSRTTDTDNQAQDIHVDLIPLQPPPSTAPTRAGRIYQMRRI